MRSFRVRIHEWIADRWRWAQYPRVSVLPKVQRYRRPVFLYSMPLVVRFALLVFSLILIVVGLLALTPVVALLYLILK